MTYPLRQIYTISRPCLKKAFLKEQYQHASYHHFLEGHGIKLSIPRKDDSLDNGMIKFFFRLMFYGYEKSYQSLEELEQAIVDYIDYYNHKRIKVKLKGLSPVQYRTQSLQ